MGYQLRSKSKSCEALSWFKINENMRRNLKYMKPFVHKGDINVGKDAFGIFCLKYSKTCIVLALGNGIIEIRSEIGEKINEIRPTEAQDVYCTYLTFLPKNDSTLFSSSIDGKIHMYNILTLKKNIFAEEPNNEILSFNICNNSTNLVTAGKDLNLRIYDVESAKLYRELFSENLKSSIPYQGIHHAKISKVKFLPDSSSVFLSGGWDSCVKIWDIRLKVQCTRTIRGPFILGDSIDIRENVMLTGSWKGTNSLQLWDLGSGHLIKTVMPFNRCNSIDGDYMLCTKYFQNGQDPNENILLTGGSGQGALEAIDINRSKVVASFKVKKPIYSIDMEGSSVAYGGKDSVLSILEYDDLLKNN